MQDTVQEASLDSKIDNELVKNNVTDAVIGSLKQKYGTLRLKALDDKESYLEVKEAAKECAKIRNLATKVCKAGREEAVKIQKQWVAKEKEVVGKISEVEDPLDAEIKKFDDEVERKKQEEIKRKEQVYINRTQQLTKMGALYSDNHFSLGDFSIEGELVKECDEEIWNLELLPKFQEQYKIIEAERLEQERIKKEREEKERLEREEFQRKQKEFEEQQAAFKRQQEEADRAAKQAELKRQSEELEAKRIKQEAENKLWRSRLEALNEIGWNGQYAFFKLSGNDNTPVFTYEELITLSESDFIERRDKHNSDVEKYIEEKKKADELKMQAAIEEQKRVAAENERKRIEEEQRQAEIKRQQEEARKAEELAKAGDKANWEHFMEQLNKITVPSFKSGQYRSKAAEANSLLQSIKSLK